jgi:TRAP-type C4-dicarboxylate transport system permease small subunit
MWRVKVYGRGILLIAARLALLGGIAWLVLNWGGTTLFGLPQPWSTLLALGIALVALPVLGYLLFLAVVLLYPIVTGKPINWR